MLRPSGNPLPYMLLAVMLNVFEAAHSPAAQVTLW